MKIQKLQIKNSFLGWEFDEIKFENNLTLLVGISGAGKTQILKSLDILQDITRGESVNGLTWVVTFVAEDNNSYRWEGGFSTISSPSSIFEGRIRTLPFGNDDPMPRPTILFEKLTDLSQGIEILSRNDEEIIYKNVKTPKLSSHQSVLFTLKEEKEIASVVEAFDRILLRDQTKKEGLIFSNQSIRELKKKYKTEAKIRNSSEHLKIKLLLCDAHKLSIFDEIKKLFVLIFPQVEDLKILAEPSVPKDMTIPVVLIREHGVDRLISEDRISSGMMRTLLLICELLLSQDGSIVLIDEFENSLGVNCINTLTELIINEKRGLQFVMTSHHPYIINNIPYEYWKIVTRIGGLIKVSEPAHYSLGRSKQDAFLQLTKILESTF